jgi:hypothetical protein
MVMLLMFFTIKLYNHTIDRTGSSSINSTSSSSSGTTVAARRSVNLSHSQRHTLQHTVNGPQRSVLAGLKYHSRQSTTSAAVRVQSSCVLAQLQASTCTAN